MYEEVYNSMFNIINQQSDIDGKDELLEYIKTDSFKKSLNRSLANFSVDPSSLLDLFWDYIKDHFSFNKEECLKYIYDWILYKSFPQKTNIDFNHSYDNLVSTYLYILREFCKYEISYNKKSFLHKYPVSFLTKEEEENIKNPEYFHFKEIFFKNWIYELMKLDQCITGHNTIEHIAGVNNLSLYLSRQLKNLEIPLDLGIIAGASIGHDIGKYGLKEGEEKRVAYLHYYYTDEWFKHFSINTIGHIATNHSTWDLELENLPIESLILIYSDFRVKSKNTDGVNHIHIYTLDEAFDVILNKLDNVDEKKEKRYRKVYSKLKDFENFMKSLGVNTETVKKNFKKPEPKLFSLMQEKEIVENLKYFSIEHNIFLMNKLMNNQSFNNILESARSEYNWQKLSTYLQIFYEYSTYLTQEQKIKTLYFLYDLLLHKEEAIRKEAAQLIGILIGSYDEEYRKETPKSVNNDTFELKSSDILNNTIKLILFPEHKIQDFQEEWLYNIKNVINSLFLHCHKSKYESYANVLISYYNNYLILSETQQFYLLQTVEYIPFESLNRTELSQISKYIIEQIKSPNFEIRLQAWDSIKDLSPYLKNDNKFIPALKKYMEENYAPSSSIAEDFLRVKIADKLALRDDIINTYKNSYARHKDIMSDIFFNNLKTATPWINKKINIDILYEELMKSSDPNGLHTAMHFCNLLKVSAIERVRNYAGETLIKIFNFLTLDQRNDIVIELSRALEMQSYQFTKYIPEYLGRIILYLRPIELDELIDDMEVEIKKSNVQIAILLLKTVGVAIENYKSYGNNFKEEIKVNRKRLKRLLGILLMEMANFNPEISTYAFRVLGTDIFGSSKLTLNEKHDIFLLVSKKILTLLTKREENEFLFLNNSASLNYIYRFISDYEFNYGEIDLKRKKNIAFFPGTFDPFTLSHKEIAMEIRDMGFEVYLAVDEFSWSKRTQPHSFRINIMRMSIAQELDIYLFPSEIPIGLNNSKDLNKLKNLFPDSDVYIVIGSDVILNASSYKNNSPIHKFPHIIFNRETYISEENQSSILEEKIKKIKGHVVRLSLPPQYEDISSTKIRESIDKNRDISKLIDSVAEQYIFKLGLYVKEPQYKTLVQKKTFEVKVYESLGESLIEDIIRSIGKNIDITFLENIKNKSETRVLVIKDSENKNVLAFSLYHWLKSSMIFDEFQDSNLTEEIRKNAKGRIVVLDGIYAKNNSKVLIETILNETLAFLVSDDYNYCIYKNNTQWQKMVENILPLLGFAKSVRSYNGKPIFMVDMNNPSTLDLDIEDSLKEIFRENKDINKVIEEKRNELKKAIVNLYPGELLLSFSKDMIYSKLIQQICDTNKVSSASQQSRQSGPCICAPFGSILNGCILPNTITKTIHTEKIFDSDIKNFSISAFPNYLSLENQIKVLRSFNKPLILVDDLLHKGYRIKVLEPLVRGSNIKIEKIIVGILSGRGKEIADMRNLNVSCAYFIPNLKLWFNESAQYPFLGGDMVQIKNRLDKNLIPSINLILPYVSPNFIKNTSKDNIYNLSEVCLKNTYEILEKVEEVYQDINKKNLTLKRLKEVIQTPRCPDIGINMDYDMNLSPSVYVKRDLEHLNRLKNIFKR